MESFNSKPIHEFFKDRKYKAYYIQFIHEIFALATIKQTLHTKKTSNAMLYPNSKQNIIQM